MRELTQQQHTDLEAALKSLLHETSDVVQIPGEFLQTVEKLGAHPAICDFLRPDGGFPKELLKIHQAGKLTLTIESLVLKPEWKDLFDEHLLLEASNRLNEVAAVMA